MLPVAGVGDKSMAQLNPSLSGSCQLDALPGQTFGFCTASPSASERTVIPAELQIRAGQGGLEKTRMRRCSLWLGRSYTQVPIP